jgi:hypothetical protein
MLQKLLALTFLVLVIGRLLFRPQLRQLGQRLDKLVSVMVVAIAISYAGQLLFFVLTRK